MQYFESDACWSDGRACAGSSTPKRRARFAALAERRDERIVGPDDERRLGRQLRDRRPPALGDVLELAVAVELVAEQVPEADDPGPCAPHHLGERELVDLEQTELRVSRGEQRGRDPGRQVRAGAIPGKSAHGGEDRARHRGRRRLAVRRGHERDARRETLRRARRALRGRASRRASPAAWCRRPGASHVRAARRIGRPRSRARGGPASRERTDRRSLCRSCS